MDCEKCGAPLDVSATKDNLLRCNPCRLVFVVKQDGELQPVAFKAPDGIEPADFFASFTANLGFEDDEEPESGRAEAGAARRPRGPLVIGLLVLVVVVIASVVLLRGVLA